MHLSDRETLRRALLELSRTGRFEFPEGPSASYLAGAADVLQMLGLLTAEKEAQSHPTSEAAQLFLRSMAAHLDDNIPLALDWQTPRGRESAAHGTELLAAVESLRSDNLANPTPIREIHAVNAVISARHDSQVYLLMQYDDRAGQFQLIGGKIESDDRDPAHALLREMQEELELPGLQMPRDFELIPLAERFEKVELSPTFGVVTRYLIQFFQVCRMRFTLAANDQTRWINLDDVRRGSLPDGRKVSALALQSLENLLETLEPSTNDPIQVD
jgi:8-oxo-dGTP pyrophosphatase MutT (NUDIX family)